MKKLLVLTYIILFALTAGCSTGEAPVRCGADRLEEYLPLIEGKQIALVANHSSVVGINEKWCLVLDSLFILHNFRSLYALLH